MTKQCAESPIKLTTMKRRISLLSITAHLTVQLLTLTSPTCHVQGWGKEGHEIVANIAYNLLTPQTQQAATRLLFPNNTYDEDDNENDNGYGHHMSPLGVVSTWADKVKFTKYFAWTAPLHFVDVRDGLVKGGCPIIPEKEIQNAYNRDSVKDSKMQLQNFQNDAYAGLALELPVGKNNKNEREQQELTHDCRLTYSRDCQKDMCAIGATVIFGHQSMYPQSDTNTSSNSSIQKRHNLRGTTYSNEDSSRSKSIHKYSHNVTQRQSLMFLIHIIGDIHQPLHVSRESDKGGNTFHVYVPNDVAHVDANGNSNSDNTALKEAERMGLSSLGLGILMAHGGLLGRKPKQWTLQ